MSGTAIVSRFGLASTVCTIVQFWYPSQYVVSTVIIGKNRKSFNGETNVELQARLNPER